MMIDRARVAVRGGSVEGSPKSKSSHRLVSFSSVVLRVLSNHLQCRKDLFEAIGIRWAEECRLFCNDQGKPYNPSSFSHAFKRMAKKAGFPNVRLHDARHAHATILLRAGVHPKIVQDRLGHSTITTTMDIYSHVMSEIDITAAEAFEDFG